MQADALISGLAHTIQLALAPVFLLSGVGAFLGVLTHRLARIIDRMRSLESPSAPDVVADAGQRDAELRVLWARTHLINRAITLCTYCALLIAAVVAAIFIGSVANIDLATPVSVAFVAAMFALIAGLLSFLREVHLSIRRLRQIGPPRQAP